MSDSLAWGGYSNGLIPVNAMSEVGNFAPLYPEVNATVLSDVLRADAARQLGLLQSAFSAAFQRALNVSEAYRSLSRQQILRQAYEAYLRGGPYSALAADPGTSRHGWGLAVDFGSGVETFGSAEKVWMDANAPKYGWEPAGNGFARPEAWHFEFTATPTITTASETITAIIKKDPEMADHIYLVTNKAGKGTKSNQGILPENKTFLFVPADRVVYSVANIEGVIAKAAGEKIVAIAGADVWQLVNNGNDRKRF